MFDELTADVTRARRNVLGTPKQSVWEDLKLAIRNTVKPSRVLRMTYAIASLVEPGTSLKIVVEANVTERTPHLPVIKIPFEFPFQDRVVSTQVSGYYIHEMLGTKMRALFQRRRGRDLFDLYWALTLASRRLLPPGSSSRFCIISNWKAASPDGRNLFCCWTRIWPTGDFVRT